MTSGVPGVGEAGYRAGTAPGTRVGGPAADTVTKSDGNVTLDPERGVGVRAAWWVLGAVGLVGVGIVAAPVSPVVTSSVIAVVGGLVAAAFFAGPRLVRAPRRPWQLLGLSFVLTVLSVPCTPGPGTGPAWPPRPRPR